MEGVRSRFIAGLAALLLPLVVTAPAPAQSDEDERSKAVEEIYKDYRDDGVIEACDHTKRALKRTLEDLAPEADVETPDLRPALEAGIEQHESDDCENQPDPTPTPTPTPSSTPTPTSTPAPTAAPVPDTSDDDFGTVAPLPGSGDDGGGGDAPLAPEDVAPLDPEITPVPPAATPAPETVPPEPSGTPPEPVYANEDDPLPVVLLVPAGLLALLALLALAYAALSRLGWGERRLAGVRRAWSEAAFRAGGTWGDFADWIRVGR